MYAEYVRGQALLHEGVLLTVRDKLDAVDAQLAQAELFAKALSLSGFLSRQDFATFHQGTVKALRDAKLDLSVVVYDAKGQQLLHSDKPYGVPLPVRQELAQVQSVFATGLLTGSTVISRTSAGHAMIGAMVPVFIASKVAYALTVAFNPKHFDSLVERRYLLRDSVVVILDSTGTIAARSLDREPFIGQKGQPALLKHLAKQSEGTFEESSAAGVSIQTTYRRSLRSGWTVAIDIPLESLEASLERDLLVFSVGAAVLLTLSLVMAWLVGRRIAKSVRALHTAAVALGAGTIATLPPVALLEANEVRQAIAVSAQLLTTRTKELLDANASLHERTTELAEAQHISQIGNWTWIFKDNDIFASEELLRQLGPNALPPLQGRVDTALLPEVWQQLDAAIKETVRSGTGYSLELPILNKEGIQIWVNARGKAVLNSDGRVTGLRGTVQDITQSKAAATATLENETRLKMALASSDLALWDWHIQSGDLFFDERWAAIQGYAWHEIPVNKDMFTKGVFTKDLALINKNLDSHFRGDSAKYEAVYRVQHKDGHWVWVQSTGRIVERDAHGQPLRMLGVALDVTERKNHEGTMEALHDEMNAMLVWQVAQHTVAALAHEINQPLASLAILCEVAHQLMSSSRSTSGEDAETSSRCNDTLGRMNTEIERAGSVLRSLLISVNKPDITRATATVNDLVAQSIHIALAEGVYDYPIVTEFAADLPPVKANWLQVSKVLLNLIHNGAQAMHAAHSPNGKIVVSTLLASDGREICISVQDAGPGISDLVQQEIFQPFISTKAHGLGLGLTISRALIEAHGGKLWATSARGQGATFHFTLPTAG